MKTTEMIAKVKDSQDILIVNERGLVVKTDSMRDLGFVLYEISRQVQLGGKWVLCEAMNLTHYMPVVLLLAVKPDNASPNPDDHLTFDKIEYVIDIVNLLEFDSFGELENWSHVSEEDATQLLTKAPAEPIQTEGVDLFKQVFDLIGLNYGDYFVQEVDDVYAQFMHKTEDRYVDIMFDKGLVQIGHAGNSEPPRRLKITLEPIESKAYGVDAFQVPDERTGYEVKAS